MASKTSRKKKATKKRSSFNAILWTVVITIILFYAVININNIRNTVQQLQYNAPSEETSSKTETTSPKEHQTPQNISPIEKTEKAPIIPKIEEANSKEQSDQSQENTIDSYIYLVKIRDDNSFSLVKVSRSIKNTKAVLGETLKSLMQGSTSTDTQRDIRTLIPSSSAVRSIAVKNGIAYIDMNDNFQFNTLGPVASNIQIYQLVYTSTEFPTIQKIQILINGKRIPYLHSEGGISIASPLSRDDLPPIPIE